MLLVSFFFIAVHTGRARGYFRYVLTVVCKYNLYFLGPYSRSRPSSMFIVPGRTELILLS